MGVQTKTAFQLKPVFANRSNAVNDIKTTSSIPTKTISPERNPIRKARRGSSPCRPCYIRQAEVRCYSTNVQDMSDIFLNSAIWSMSLMRIILVSIVKITG